MWPIYSHHYSQQNPMYSSSQVRRLPRGHPDQLQVNDRVNWNFEGVPQLGTVKWIGTATSEDRLYAGVEFDVKRVGTMNGKVNGTRLFYCKKGHGRMVPVDELTLSFRPETYTTLEGDPYMNSGYTYSRSCGYPRYYGGGSRIYVVNSPPVLPFLNFGSTPGAIYSQNMPLYYTGTPPTSTMPYSGSEENEFVHFTPASFETIKVGDSVIWIPDSGLGPNAPQERSIEGRVKWLGYYKDRIVPRAIVEFTERRPFPHHKLDKVFTWFGCKSQHGGLVPIGELILASDFYANQRPTESENPLIGFTV